MASSDQNPHRKATHLSVACAVIIVVEMVLTSVMVVRGYRFSAWILFPLFFTPFFGVIYFSVPRRAGKSRLPPDDSNWDGPNGKSDCD